MTPADHAAWVSARATVWAAAFSGISMLGVLWGAYVATRAAKTWRGVHDAAAADQCVATAYDCLSAVDRIISMRWFLDGWTHPISREAIQLPTEAITDAWEVWSRFRTAHVVASRYYTGRLATTAPQQIADQLNELEAWCGTFYGRNPGDPFGTDVDLRLLANRKSDEIRAIVDTVADQVAEALRPAPPPTPLWSRAQRFATAAWARVRRP